MFLSAPNKLVIFFISILVIFMLSDYLYNTINRTKKEYIMTNNTENISRHVRWITVCGLFMAINIALSSIGVPVPGGHFYLNDIIIVAAALYLNPLGAFLVGGVGAFLGDFFFYPAPMFVSLVTHGLEAAAISYIARLGHHKLSSIITGGIIGAIIMVIGYSIGRAYIYSTPEYAIIKLPMEILQAGIGVVFGIILYRYAPLYQVIQKVLQEK